MKLNQNDRERILDRVRRGEMTPAEGNIEMIRCERVRLTRGPIGRDIRKQLAEAVKAGQLGRLPKDGHKPEAYYHPTFEYLAHAERKEAELSALRALAGVITRPS